MGFIVGVSVKTIMKKEFLTSGQLMEAVRKLDYKVQGMITIKDLNDIAENKIKNDAQKAIIRASFPPHIADRMCAAIDDQERIEHFMRLLNEYNEWMVQQQRQQAAVMEFLRQYKK